MLLFNETCPYCGAVVFSNALHIFSCPAHLKAVETVENEESRENDVQRADDV